MTPVHPHEPGTVPAQHGSGAATGLVISCEDRETYFVVSAGRAVCAAMQRHEADAIVALRMPRPATSRGSCLGGRPALRDRQRHRDYSTKLSRVGCISCS